MPNPPRRTQAERRDTTRRALVEHALRIFATRGFEAATLADIAEAAGVSKGGVHHHFSAKRDLVVPVFMAATETIEARIRDAVAEVNPPLARIRAGFEAMRTIVGAEDAPAPAAWVECVVAARRDPELSAAIGDERRRLETRLRDAIRGELDAAGVPRSEWSDEAAGAAIGWAIGRVLSK